MPWYTPAALLQVAEHAEGAQGDIANAMCSELPTISPESGSKAICSGGVRKRPANWHVGCRPEPAVVRAGNSRVHIREQLRGDSSIHIRDEKGEVRP